MYSDPGVETARQPAQGVYLVVVSEVQEIRDRCLGTATQPLIRRDERMRVNFEARQGETVPEKQTLLLVVQLLAGWLDAPHKEGEACEELLQLRGYVVPGAMLFGVVEMRFSPGI
jgi:hypothetical protein